MTSTNLDDGLDKLTVGQLFDQVTYRIPLYQRAYAWTASEVHTLMRDIRDARLNSKSLSYNRDYYLGSLVVNKVRDHDEIIYEVIDGQQRLTTLFILLSIVPRVTDPEDTNWSEVLRDKLKFEGRDRSQNDLNRLARDGAKGIGLLTTDGIAHAAELIHAAAHRSTSDNDDIANRSSEVTFNSDDLEYLLHHVRIVRTQLPPNTDLNHYFEVMNTRGEQLEKHEILKARLLKKLKSYPKHQSIMSRIWDACKHLNRHIQVQFSTTTERKNIFGANWDAFEPKDSTSLFEQLDSGNAANDANGQIKLVDVLKEEPRASNSSEKRLTQDDPGSYGSIIDFPNLLLHVLKIKQGDQFSWHENDDHGDDQIRLEDKYLLEEFDKVLPEDGADWVRDFGWRLLRTRYLLDTYVIRTQPSLAGNENENWVLHQAYKYEPENATRQLSAKNTFSSRDDSDEEDEDDQTSPGKRVLMLQAMFQVTDTRRASKYFLFQTLQWLHDNEQHGHVEAEALARRLEASAQQRLNSLGIGDNLHKGTQVSNFIFHFLDYVLWLRGMNVDHPFAQQVNDPQVVDAIKEHVGSFSFRYRTSVEHFYPVAPDESQQHKPLDQTEFDHFGNLCIMSRSDNSARSNLIPEAKVNQYLWTNQSLKFQIMAEKTNQLQGSDQTWDFPQIERHGDQMTAVLQRVAQVELPNWHSCHSANSSQD